MREVLLYRKSRRFDNIGAYSKGSNLKVDNAIDKIDAVNGFLRQRTDENISFEDSLIN